MQCDACPEWERDVLMRGYCKKYKKQSMAWESCSEVE